MTNLFNKWRYYGLEQDDYNACKKIAFLNNINALRWANLVVFILTVLFSIFPIVELLLRTNQQIEKLTIRVVFYLGHSLIALFLFFIACFQNKRLKNEKPISNKFLFALIILYYLNIMSLGMNMAVWMDITKIAGSFIGIFICVLFLFNISPILYLGLTLTMLCVYITAIISVKESHVWNYDIQNALFAGFMGLIFGWQIIRNRITMISNAIKLKDENTIDALTRLKNRRDFMNNFQRFITTYRQTDNFLCIAMMDVDFFKNYNDHYGHSMGDECLRAIGKVLGGLHKSDGIYAARVGGEEFALLWHVVNSSDAEKTGLRVNQLIADLNIPHEKSSIAPHITISIGIHVARCGVLYDTKYLYNLADKALYAAKNQGRNRTVVSM